MPSLKGSHPPPALPKSQMQTHSQCPPSQQVSRQPDGCTWPAVGRGQGTATLVPSWAVVSGPGATSETAEHGAEPRCDPPGGVIVSESRLHGAPQFLHPRSGDDDRARLTGRLRDRNETSSVSRSAQDARLLNPLSFTRKIMNDNY